MEIVPTEAQMVQLYQEFVKNEPKQLHFEVKFYQKRIDVIEIPLIDEQVGPCHAIEFKISHWTSCFRQALCNRVLMPYNSMAIWSNFIHRVKQDQLIYQGIGLIEVSNTGYQILILPEESPFVDEYWYHKIRERLVGTIAQKEWGLKYGLDRFFESDKVG